MEQKTLRLCKRGHWHIFSYTLGEEPAMVEALIAKAEDPQCELDWFDVALISQQMGMYWAGKVGERLKIGPPKK